MPRLSWLVALAGIAGLCWFALRMLPPEWDPRAPLDLTATPNLVTSFKLARVRRDPAFCRAAFEASRIPVTRVPDRASEVGCEIGNAMRLPSALRVSPSTPIVTCPVAAAWVLYERNVLLPAGITGVAHLGTHACRNVNHAASGRRSQHATANAIDIAGFTRAGGEWRVARDWDQPGLRALRDGACRSFNAVLSPDYNAAHRDHLHLDMGRARICR
ncbi:extensin family protein [Roseococcus sp. YIM B11640]|uniref:extensin-like domain-containing protein n=1 Tax=Roseococcus sp. YIM B11640 TaxID=3133973 RepID=UPI003C799492